MDWIALLPPAWQPIAHSLVSISVAVSIALLGLKPMLGDPSPDDPTWKRLAFGVLGWADVIAASSTPISTKHEIAALKAGSIPPPPGEL